MARPISVEKPSSSSKRVSKKRQRHDEEQRGVCDISVALPVVSYLLAEKATLEKALLRVEFFDKDGKSLWSCEDLREGREQVLRADDVLPSFLEDRFCKWRRHVWTLSVSKSDRSSSDFILTSANQIEEVRVGMSSWKPKIGDGVGLDCKYDSGSQTHKLSLPLIHSERKEAKLDVDRLGPNGLYLTGTATVTNPHLLQDFAEDDLDSAWDFVRIVLPTKQQFPGDRDELRVHQVHLPISGVVFETQSFSV